MMTLTEIAVVAAITAMFCAFAAIVAWGYFQTKDLPLR
jgi:hypothetical protein